MGDRATRMIPNLKMKKKMPSTHSVKRCGARYLPKQNTTTRTHTFLYCLNPIAPHTLVILLLLLLYYPFYIYYIYIILYLCVASAPRLSSRRVSTARMSPKRISNYIDTSYMTYNNTRTKYNMSYDRLEQVVDAQYRSPCIKK